LRRLLVVGLCGFLLTAPAVRADTSPAQRVPAALLTFPLIEVEGGGQTRDTRVEIVNLTGSPKEVKCVYVNAATCAETNFFVHLTANQPMSWLVSRGFFDTKTFTAVPPFPMAAQLQCAVLPEQPGIEYHNAIQGRAVVFGSDGQTLAYGAVGFQRLSAGDFTGRIDLDGSTYSRCPDELHFAFLGTGTGSDSELLLVPCSQDVLREIPSTVVQLRMVNEFEQMLSAAVTVSCQTRRSLAAISNAFTAANLGSAHGHLIVRGVQSPVLGLIIDRFTPGAASTSANEPILRGGRAATLVIP